MMANEGRFQSLCDVMIAEILIRLPAKTLYRCNCVCKGWRSLLSDQSFIDSFFKRLISLCPLRTGFLYNNPSSTINFFEFVDDDKFVNHTSNLPFIHPSVLVVSAHNGLILCCEKPRNKEKGYGLCPIRYGVHNPLTVPTKQWQWLPLPGDTTTLYADATKKSYGDLLFHMNDPHPLIISCDKNGSRSQTIEFKVVEFRGLADSQNFIQLRTYSSETQKWQTSMISHDIGRFTVTHRYILSDGSVYLWGSYNKVLCCYDWVKDNIYQVKLPSFPENRCPYLHDLGISAGSLYYTETWSSYFLVWELVNGMDWSLKHNVDYEPLLTPLFHDEQAYCLPYAFHPSDPNLIFLRIDDSQAFLYRMDTGKVECHSRFLSEWHTNNRVIPYHFQNILA